MGNKYFVKRMGLVPEEICLFFRAYTFRNKKWNNFLDDFFFNLSLFSSRKLNFETQ
jgi:hypothetical protein